MLTFENISHIRVDAWVSSKVVLRKGTIKRVKDHNDKGCW